MKIKEKLIRIFQTEFSRNIITMVSGNAIAQAIPVIGSIILARLYLPEEIGSFTTFIGLTSVLAVLTTFKFDEAIVLQKNNEDSIAVFQLSIIANLLFTLFISLFLFLFYDRCTNMYPEISKYLYLLPLSLFLAGIYQSISYWLINIKNYKVLSFTRVGQSLSSILLQIILYKFSVFGLLIGRMIGFLFSILQSYNFIFKNIWQIDIHRIKTQFIKNISFALYNTPNSFLNQLSNSLPLFLLPTYFNMATVGFYSFSTRIALTPLGIITSSLQQIFYKEISERSNKGEDLYLYLKNIYYKLFKIALIPHLVLFFTAPFLFAFFFGEEWRTAGTYTRYLMPWFFLVFINSPISSIYIVKNKQKEYFVYEILLLISRAGALAGGYYIFNNVDVTIILFGIVGFIFNLFLIYYYLKISNIK